jgi:hypothetical protein
MPANSVSNFIKQYLINSNYVSDEITHNSMKGGVFSIPPEHWPQLWEIVETELIAGNERNTPPLTENWVSVRKDRPSKFVIDLDGLSGAINPGKLVTLMTALEDILGCNGLLQAILCSSGQKADGTYSYHLIVYNVGIPIDQQEEITVALHKRVGTRLTWPKPDVSIYGHSGSLRMLGCCRFKKNEVPRVKRAYMEYNQGLTASIISHRGTNIYEKCSLLVNPVDPVDVDFVPQEQVVAPDDVYFVDSIDPPAPNQQQEFNLNKDMSIPVLPQKRSSNKEPTDESYEGKLERKYDPDALEEVCARITRLFDPPLGFIRDKETGRVKVKMLPPPGPITLQLRCITNNCPVGKKRHKENNQVCLRLSPKGAIFTCLNDSCQLLSFGNRQITKLPNYENIFPDSPLEQTQKKQKIHPKEELLTFLREDISDKGHRTDKSHRLIYKPLLDSNGLFVGFYENSGTIEEYVYDVTSESNNKRMHGLRVKFDLAEKMVNELAKDRDVLPELKYTPLCFSFSNGMICGRHKRADKTWGISFEPHTDDWDCHKGKIALNYWPTVPVDTDWLKELAEAVDDEKKTDEILDSKKTPFFDQIFKDQGISDQVKKEALAFMIRVCDRNAKEGRERWEKVSISLFNFLPVFSFSRLKIISES